MYILSHGLTKTMYLLNGSWFNCAANFNYSILIKTVCNLSLHSYDLFDVCNQSVYVCVWLCTYIYSLVINLMNCYYINLYFLVDAVKFSINYSILVIACDVFMMWN